MKLTMVFCFVVAAFCFLVGAALLLWKRDWSGLTFLLNAVTFFINGVTFKIHWKRQQRESGS